MVAVSAKYTFNFLWDLFTWLPSKFSISKIRIVFEGLSTMNKVTFVTMRLATYFGKLENLIKLN